MIDMGLITLIIGGSIFVLLLFIFVFFMKMDVIVRAKFKAMISRKPYGVAYFHLANIVYPKVVDFNETSLNMKNGKYFISRDAVVIQKNVAGKEKKDEYDITQFIVHQQGVPTIHFNYDNATPIIYKTDKDEKVPDPKQIQAIYNKELEWAEAELMYHNRDTLKKFAIIGIVLSIIIIAVVIYDTVTIMNIAKDIAPAVAPA